MTMMWKHRMLLQQTVAKVLKRLMMSKHLHINKQKAFENTITIKGANLSFQKTTFYNGECYCSGQQPK